MLNSSILDVAIGMAFIYLLLSLIASTIQEAIASLLQLRPANLEHGIRSLFSGGELATGVPFVDRLYRHGLIMGLYREHVDPTGRVARKISPLREWLRRLFRVHQNPAISGVSDPFYLPAYIPARTFAIALLDILKVEAEDKRVKDALARTEAENTRVALNDADASPGAGETTSSIAVNGDASATLPRATSPLDPLKDIGNYLESLCARQKATGSPTSYAAAEAMLSLLTDARTIDGSTAQLEKFRCHLENWYNDSMDRASGWYKKYTQNVLLLIGLLLAIVFNVDSITVGKKLWFDKDARSGLINAAGTYVGAHTPPPKVAAQPGETTLTKEELVTQMKTTVQAFNDVSEAYLLPVGWHAPGTWYHYNLLHPLEWRLLRIFAQWAGWIITALALSLGAPFWFDLLNKFMVVRSTVKPSEKSRTEASKDAT